jgi:hypothetical protein
LNIQIVLEEELQILSLVNNFSHCLARWYLYNNVIE